MAANLCLIILSLIVITLTSVTCQQGFVEDFSTTTEETPAPLDVNEQVDSIAGDEQATQTKLLSVIVDLLQRQNEQQNQMISLLQKHDILLENVTQQQGIHNQEQQMHNQEQKQQLGNLIQLQNVQNKVQGSVVSLLQRHDKKLENVTHHQSIQNHMLSTMVSLLEARNRSSVAQDEENSEEIQTGNMTNESSAMISYEAQILTRMESSFQNYADRQGIQLDLFISTLHSPRYCSDVIYHQYQYGVFTISPPDGLESLPVACEFTDDTAWIIFQRRLDGSHDFFSPDEYYRHDNTYSGYINGFGDLNGEHWLGLEKLYRLTRNGIWQLRIDLEDFHGNTAYAEYSNFVIRDLSDNYTLSIGNYSGTAGDSLRYHDNMPFSTYDREHGFMNCPVYMQGAWWYFGCADSNLNGQFIGSSENNHTGIFWKHWKGFEALKRSEMKIRRIYTPNKDAYQDQSKSGDMTKQPTPVTSNCADINIQNLTNSYGIHSVKKPNVSFDVVCNSDNNSDGWIVLQTRFDGSENFYRSFENYMDGFGNLTGEHWLGLEKIHKLTSNGTWQLRIQLEDCYGSTSYADYSNFAIGDESTNYTLCLGDYSGTAGDSLSYSANRPFSTYDQDHDTNNETCQGAWWYGNCAWSNLNGLYKATHRCIDNYYRDRQPVVNSRGMMWFDWKNSWEALRKSEIKMKQISLQNQDSNPILPTSQPASSTQITSVPARDCSDIKDQGASRSYGVYSIQPSEDSKSFDVVCNITNDEAWIVIQRRFDGSVNFYRPWQDYEEGFGELTGEHWLGLNKLHNLTKTGSWQLRVDIYYSSYPSSTYAVYSNFAIGSGPTYTLTASGYSGDAGDHLGDYGNGNAFSTYDRDNDPTSHHCALSTKSAWWHGSNCYSYIYYNYIEFHPSINGLYGEYYDNTGMEWSNRRPTKSVMKIRRI